MAGIAEADQRYYSVTSASELLKELMNGKTVSVVKVTTSWSTTTYTDGVAGTPEQNKDGTGSKNPDVKEYIVTDKNAAQILSAVDTFLVDSNQISGNGAMGTSLPITSILNDAAYKYYNNKTTIPTTSDGDPRKLTLTSNMNKIKVNGTEVDPLAVTIEETLDNTGRITLTVYNTNGDRFRQELVFGANVIQDGDIKSVEGSPENHKLTGDGRNSYTVTTTKTVTEITTLTWTLDSIKTV